MEGVARSVTRRLIREARALELRREALNSEKLRMHFEDNPAELQLLRHAAAKQLIQPQPHLKDIPDYLIPEALKPQVEVREEAKRPRSGSFGKEGKRQRAADPLQVGEAGRGKCSHSQ